MKHYRKQDILSMAAEEGIELIYLQFIDVFGILKNVVIPAGQLEQALENKCTFDGSSIEGFVRIEESDMYLYPDPTTFQILPWRFQQHKAARLMCDVYRPEGIPFEGDSRYILKKSLRKCASMGYAFEVGPECEFFLFHTDEQQRPVTTAHERAGYFEVTPLDLGETTRREAVLMMEKMGFRVEASHHEVAPFQHEVDFQPNNALLMADILMTFRMTMRALAQNNGLCATFMPKPVSGVDGSGLHLNMSLKREGKNIFFEKKDKMKLSKECYHFIAGLLEHARGMSLICNPLVNSYKRLVPGYEAPVAISWSAMNRSPLIRIPASRGASTRIELRSPDPSCNPYLVMAVCLEAGLEGIEKGIEAPDPIGKNMYELSSETLRKLCVKLLPGNLREACDAFEQDQFVQKVLGEHISRKFLEAKKREWLEYSEQVSKWERDAYLIKY